MVTDDLSRLTAVLRRFRKGSRQSGAAPCMASATVRRWQLIADAESYPQRCGGPLGAHGKPQTVRRGRGAAVWGLWTRTSASGIEYQYDAYAQS